MQENKERTKKEKMQEERQGRREKRETKEGRQKERDDEERIEKRCWPHGGRQNGIGEVFVLTSSWSGSKTPCGEREKRYLWSNHMI